MIELSCDECLADYEVQDADEVRTMDLAGGQLTIQFPLPKGWETAFIKDEFYVACSPECMEALKEGEGDEE